MVLELVGWCAGNYRIIGNHSNSMDTHCVRGGVGRESGGMGGGSASAITEKYENLFVLRVFGMGLCRGRVAPESWETHNSKDWPGAGEGNEWPQDHC